MRSQPIANLYSNVCFKHLETSAVSCLRGETYFRKNEFQCPVLHEYGCKLITTEPSSRCHHCAAAQEQIELKTPIARREEGSLVAHAPVTMWFVARRYFGSVPPLCQLRCVYVRHNLNSIPSGFIYT